MPCPCTSCTCGDDCRCKPGEPGCDPCGAFQREKAAAAAAIPPSTSKPFTLMVNLTFKDGEAEQVFLDSMLPYAAWVKANEPNTLTYQLMKSDKPVAEKGIYYGIIERYADKERDFLGAHRNSAQFKEFRAVLKELQDEDRCEVVGDSYNDV
ncbi:hypothetical protein TeGR_g6392 [Tetraparma gracilis]|uniref:ABM domain-containing protein n=1 Tax=Tetraparma gracilis TaxID=2962635 RepID=A0ABQ6N8Y0_9STRA|nr:hypothetical protein TeGR_g6392 [Tetraparma gracilis]